MRLFLAMLFASALVLLVGGRADAQTPVRTISDFTVRSFQDFVRITATDTHSTAVTSQQFASGDADALVTENALLGANPCTFILVGYERGENGLRHTALSGLCPRRNHGALATATVTFATFCRGCVSRDVWVIPGRPVHIPQTLPGGAVSAAPVTAAVPPIAPEEAVDPVDPPTQPVSATVDASVATQSEVAAAEAVPEAPTATEDAPVQMTGATTEEAPTLPSARERELAGTVATLTARIRDLEAHQANPLDLDERHELSNLRDRLHGSFTTAQVLWICGFLMVVLLVVGTMIGFSVGRSKNPKRQVTAKDWQDHLTKEDLDRGVDEEPLDEFDFAVASRKSAEQALGAAHDQAMQSLRESHAKALQDAHAKHQAELDKANRELARRQAALDAAAQVYEEREAIIAHLKEEKATVEQARDLAVSQSSLPEVAAKPATVMTAVAEQEAALLPDVAVDPASTAPPVPEAPSTSPPHEPSLRVPSPDVELSQGFMGQVNSLKGVHAGGR